MSLQGSYVTNSKINRRVSSENELRDMAEEDIEEGMDRMENDGSGVVEQNNPAGAPILRNDLVLDPESSDS